MCTIDNFNLAGDVADTVSLHHDTSIGWNRDGEQHNR